MQNYKMLIAYDGTKYNGWQKQGNTKNTLQGLLEFVLHKLLGEEVQVFGSGRTDAGVHAVGQVANFHYSKTLDCEWFLNKLNKSLPKDIAVTSFEKVEERFHSRLNAKEKIYEYKIWNSNISDVFRERYMFQYSDTLDIKKMEEVANCFVGTHDFLGFCSNKRYKKSTVRTIYSVNVKKVGNEISIVFHGNGFLYNMVRILAGTVLAAGEGKMSPIEVLELFQDKKREDAGDTLPAKGLTLKEVRY